MSDLVTWLRAQLDEEERVAQDAAEQDWSRALSYAGDLTEHVDMHNPARVLADVEAKRRILDDHNPDWPRLECPTCCGYDGNDNYGVERRPREAYPCRVVRWLASSYADQPGYDESWRP